MNVRKASGRNVAGGSRIGRIVDRGGAGGGAAAAAASSGFADVVRRAGCEGMGFGVEKAGEDDGLGFFGRLLSMAGARCGVSVEAMAGCARSLLKSTR